VRQLREKLKKYEFDLNFINTIKELTKVAFQKEGRTASLIAIGALFYFINPVDVISDYILPIGYVDDLSIMTLPIPKIRSMKL